MGLLYLYLTLVSGFEAGNWRTELPDINGNTPSTDLYSLKFCISTMNWFVSLKFSNATLAKHVFIAYHNGKCFIY